MVKVNLDIHGGCTVGSLGNVTLLRGNSKKIMWDIKEARCEERAPGSPGNGSVIGNSVSFRQPPARMLVWRLHSFFLFTINSKCSGKVIGARITAEIIHFRVFMPAVPRACTPH